MAVSVVISSVTLNPGGGVVCVGTVNGGSNITVTIAFEELIGLSVSQIQQIIAVHLCVNAGISLVFASLAGTVTL